MERRQRRGSKVERRDSKLKGGAAALENVERLERRQRWSSRTMERVGTVTTKGGAAAAAALNEGNTTKGGAAAAAALNEGA